MKRSPSSSCSSSSSCIETEINPIELANNKPKIKRARAKKTAPNQDRISNNESSNAAGRRSSIYRGVTRHRWTGRYEAHLWDKSTYNSIQNKKGRQIYLGAYDDEDAAARTYDLAALKYWGPGTILNFTLETYTKDIEAMEKMTKEEYLASLRRQSSGFSRGVSKYRGVARHHHNGRWEARIGRVFGNKYLYLGTYGTQEEAAAAYDMAAIEYRGPNAVTNFDASVYADRLKEKKTKDSHSQKVDTPSPCLSENQGRPRGKTDKPEGQEHHQEKQEEAKQALVQTQDLNLEIPSSVTMYENNEHPWSLCMDPEFHPLPIQDVTYARGGGDLPYLFGETGFQDDVEFIFDGPMGETLLFDTDSFFENSNVKEETENNMGGPETGQVGQSSVSSPSSSTTTLNYCN